MTELRREADGDEFSPIMALVSRHNPVLRHWSATGVVLVADALDVDVVVQQVAYRAAMAQAS